VQGNTSQLHSLQPKIAVLEEELQRKNAVIVGLEHEIQRKRDELQVHSVLALLVQKYTY